MNRRHAILAIAALGAPLRLMAQLAPKAPRIGVLSGGTAESAGYLVQAFIKGMAELGYQDGKNVRYETRFSDGSVEKTQQNARELVAAGVDLIWAPAPASVAAVQKATMSLPIVFALVGDPVASGFVRSLPRPGTNASGLSVVAGELGAKRIEILNETFPNVRRVDVLHDPGESWGAIQLPFVQASRKLGKELMVVEARAPEDFAVAFNKLAAWRAGALVILESTMTVTHRKTLVDLAAKHRWPTITSAKEFVEAGAVIAYGADWQDNCRRSAVYVDKILKGAKPADLPVQRPIKFELVINLKAAKAMGLSIPQAMLLRADRVIE